MKHIRYFLIRMFRETDL